MESGKRKRSENWDSSDKLLLQQLIEERVRIIEDKRTDANTSKCKKDAWKEILTLFNQCSLNKRDVGQLQNQWRNTKMNVKKRISQYKKEKVTTGGGPAPKSPSASDEHIISLIPEEFEVDHNSFDCDGHVPDNPIITYENEEFLEDFYVENTETPLIDAKKPEKPKRGKNTASAMSDEQLKARFLEISIEAKKQEMKAFQIEHEWRVKSLENDETRKQEEHELKIQLLKEQLRVQRSL